MVQACLQKEPLTLRYRHMYRRSCPPGRDGRKAGRDDIVVSPLGRLTELVSVRVPHREILSALRIVYKQPLDSGVDLFWAYVLGFSCVKGDSTDGAVKVHRYVLRFALENGLPTSHSPTAFEHAAAHPEKGRCPPLRRSEAYDDGGNGANVVKYPLLSPLF